MDVDTNTMSGALESVPTLRAPATEFSANERRQAELRKEVAELYPTVVAR